MKAELSEYSEDVEEMQEIVKTKQADIKLTKGARRYSYNWLCIVNGKQYHKDISWSFSVRVLLTQAGPYRTHVRIERDLRYYSGSTTENEPLRK